MATIYERIGKEEGLLKIVNSVFYNMKQNETLSHCLKSIDENKVKKEVLEFIKT